MKPTTLKDRMNLDEEAIFEDSSNEGMSDEDLKIEALKIATNIGKLMSDVTTEDIVSIAETVAKFIKGGDSAELTTTAEEAPADTEETPEEFETTDTEATDNSDETSENESADADTAEEFEI